MHKIIISTIFLHLITSIYTQLQTQNHYNNIQCQFKVNTNNLNQFVSCTVQDQTQIITNYGNCYQICCNGMISDTFLFDDLRDRCPYYRIQSADKFIIIRITVLIVIGLIATIATLIICCRHPSCKLYHSNVDCSCLPCLRSNNHHNNRLDESSMQIHQRRQYYQSGYVNHSLKALDHRIQLQEHQIEMRIDEMNECTICLQNRTNMRTSCNHYYHMECLALWFTKNRFCPYCKNIKLQYFQVLCGGCQSQALKSNNIHLKQYTCTNCKDNNVIKINPRKQSSLN